MVCNLFAESDSVFRNEGAYFTDVTAEVGLGITSRLFTRMGLGWVDFDNDGNLDLFEANGRVGIQSKSYSDDPYAEPNLVFRGSGGGRFEEVLPRGGTAELLVAHSRSAAFGDVDNDGGMDIVVINGEHAASLLLNVVPNRGNWILFRVLDEHGRDAEGAALTIRVGDRTLRRDVRTAYSFQAANSPRVHVGLGAATEADGVTVRWPDGVVEDFGTQPANEVVTLRRSGS